MSNPIFKFAAHSARPSCSACSAWSAQSARSAWSGWSVRSAAFCSTLAQPPAFGACFAPFHLYCLHHLGWLHCLLVCWRVCLPCLALHAGIVPGDTGQDTYYIIYYIILYCLLSTPFHFYCLHHLLARLLAGLPCLCLHAEIVPRDTGQWCFSLV